MTQLEQITWLNGVVKLRLAPSKIHGVGVFALKSINKGEKLYADLFPQLYNVPFSSFGKFLPEVREVIQERWPNVINGSMFAYPDTNMQAYMNHSFDPNVDTKLGVALRDIEKGEEITEDYTKIEGYEKIYTWLSQPKKKKSSKS